MIAVKSLTKVDWHYSTCRGSNRRDKSIIALVTSYAGGAYLHYNRNVVRTFEHVIRRSTRSAHGPPEPREPRVAPDRLGALFKGFLT